MKPLRLGGALVAGSLAAVFALSPVAHAATPVVQTPEVFQGAASATGLDLSLTGQTATIGAGLAQLTSQLLSSAAGTAIMSVLGSTQSSAKIAGASNGSVTDGPRCNPVIPLVVLTIKNACTASASTMNHGLGHASTINSVEGIDLTLNSLLQSTPLGNQLASTLQGVINQLAAVVGQAAPQLSPVTDTVGNVLNNVLKTPTASLKLGQSISDVVTTADRVTSTGAANGGELDILPAPVALGGAVQPLVAVIIGSSKASAVYNRLTGKATPSVDPALVTVKLAATPLTPALTIPVTVGQTQTIALPAGLGSLSLTVAGGSTFTKPDGTVGATANAVKLGLTLLNQPLINLAIAGAQATVAGAPAVMAPPAQVAAPQSAPPALPHTGGTPWVPLAGGAVLIAFLVTRRVLAGAH
jgi:hypothetical protein